MSRYTFSFFAVVVFLVSTLLADNPFGGYTGRNWILKPRDHTVVVTANHPTELVGPSTAAYLACLALQSNNITRDTFFNLNSYFPREISHVEYSTVFTYHIDNQTMQLVPEEAYLPTSTYYGNIVADEDWVFSEEAAFILEKFSFIQDDTGLRYYPVSSTEEITLITEEEVEEIIPEPEAVVEEEPAIEDTPVEEEILEDPVEVIVEEEIVFTDLPEEEQEELVEVIETITTADENITEALNSFLNQKTLRDQIFTDIVEKTNNGVKSGDLGVYDESNNKRRVVHFNDGDANWNIDLDAVDQLAGVKKVGNGKVTLFAGDDEMELSKFVVIKNSGNNKNKAGSMDVLRLTFDSGSLSSFAQTFEAKRLKVYHVPSTVIATQETIETPTAASAGSGGGGCMLNAF